MLLRALLPPLLATLTLALASRGSPPGAPAGTWAGTVRGTVYDSLAGRPLAGASVFVEGAASVAVADSAGRFVLPDVPAGRQLVSAEHPSLEALGLSALTAEVEVRDAGEAAVALATPGRGTVWRRVCGSAPPKSAGGILFGDVRDARTDARLAGAVAAVTWTAVGTAAGRLSVEPTTLAARTDSIGAYRVCGVPLDGELEVRAGAGPHASGRASVRLDGRLLARVDLLVARDSAGEGARVAVSGVVRDTLGAARAGVRVGVDGLDSLETVTDAEGRFALGGVPAGTQTLVVRAIGYAPQVVPVALRAGRAAAVEVTLRRVAQLARVTVRVDRARQAALFDAIARRGRLSQSDLVDSTAVRRTGQLRTALSAVPFVTLEYAVGVTEWHVALPGRGGGGRCIARVFVDGFESNWTVARDLPADQIAAVEVFRGANRIPTQYAGTSALGNGACGAVFFWTKTAS